MHFSKFLQAERPRLPRSHHVRMPVLLLCVERCEALSHLLVVVEARCGLID